MEEEILDVIEEALKKHNYQFDRNCGTIWIDKDGETYSISPTKCESCDQ